MRVLEHPCSTPSRHTKGYLRVLRAEDGPRVAAARGRLRTAKDPVAWAAVLVRLLGSSVAAVRADRTAHVLGRARVRGALWWARGRGTASRGGHQCPSLRGSQAAELTA